MNGNKQEQRQSSGNQSGNPEPDKARQEKQRETKGGQESKHEGRQAGAAAEQRQPKRESRAR